MSLIQALNLSSLERILEKVTQNMTLRVKIVSAHVNENESKTLNKGKTIGKCDLLYIHYEHIGHTVDKY